MREIAFIDFLEPYARAIAFVLEHGAERAPAHIQHRLGHVGLGERRGVHVADEDDTVLPYERHGLFLQKVFFAISDFCVKRRNALRLACPLSPAERRFISTIEPLGLEHFSIACRSEVLVLSRLPRPEETGLAGLSYWVTRFCTHVPSRRRGVHPINVSLRIEIFPTNTGIISDKKISI